MLLCLDVVAHRYNIVLSGVKSLVSKAKEQLSFASKGTEFFAVVQSLLLVCPVPLPMSNILTIHDTTPCFSHLDLQIVVTHCPHECRNKVLARQSDDRHVWLRHE